MKTVNYLFLYLWLSTLTNVFGQKPYTLAIDVVGSTGKPLPAAYVKLIGRDTTIEVNRQDGRFLLSVPKAGIYQFWAGGVHYRSVNFPLLVEEPTYTRLSVQLAPIPYLQKIDTVFVTGSFNNFSLEKGLVAMTPGQDGKYRATIPANTDTLAYYLLGVQKHTFPKKAPLEGTYAHRFSYQASRPDSRSQAGKFVSVVKAPQGQAIVTFDPSLLPRSESAPVITFSNPKSRTAKIAAISLDHSRRMFTRYMNGVEQYLKDGTIGNFNEDRIEQHDSYTALIRQESDTLVRRFFLLKYFGLLEDAAKPEIAHQFFSEVPAESSVWTFELEESAYAYNWLSKSLGYSKQTNDYLLRLLSINKEPVLRLTFLYYAFQRAVTEGKDELLQLYFDQLASEFPDSKYTRFAKANYDAAKRITKGRHVPDFSLSSLEDTRVQFSPEQLKGKVYLIDFWGTWCGPCVKMIPELQELYDRYKDLGFSIISVAVKDTPEKIQIFRQTKHKMPWMHAVLENGYDHPVAQTFRLVGLPKAVLIDRDGKILGSSELEDGGLRRILAQVFENITSK